MTAMPGLEIDVSAQLCAAIQSNTDALRAAERRRAQMAAEVAFVSAPAAQFAAVPYAMNMVGFGPATGWNWAVQRITVFGLGTSDVLTAYKGASVKSVTPDLALFTFMVSTAGAVATWHPGRTGLVLLGREQGSLAWNGTLGSTVTVSCDVVQVSDAQLPYFLL